MILRISKNVDDKIQNILDLSNSNNIDEVYLHAIRINHYYKKDSSLYINNFKIDFQNEDDIDKYFRQLKELFKGVFDITEETIKDPFRI